MADDFKDVSHLNSVTPSAKTILQGIGLSEAERTSGVYAWADVLQSVTGLILGLFLFCHMAFTSSILISKDTFWSLVQFTGGYFINGEEHLWMHVAFIGTIAVLVIIHMALALRKFPPNVKAFLIMRGHYRLLRHTDTTLWWIQFLTGVILTGLVFWHILPMLMNPGEIGPYDSGLVVYNSWLWVVFVFLIVTQLHGMIGLYRLCMKWIGPSDEARVILRKVMFGLIIFMIALGSCTIMGYYYAGQEAYEKGFAEKHYVPGWLQTPQTEPYPAWWPERLKKQ